MSNDMYRTALQQAVKDALPETEFSLSGRSEFDEFILAVQELSSHYYGVLIDERKLKLLWYKSRNFQLRWKTPTRRADRAMLWAAFRCGLTRNDGKVMFLAWTTKHDRKVSQADFDEWKVRVLEPTWNDVQPRIKEYQERVMKEAIEKEQSKLKFRILEALKDGRYTTDALAKKLGVPGKAIDGQLYRMAGSAVRDGVQAKPGTGEVVRVGWGLYELAKVAQ